MVSNRINFRFEVKLSFFFYSFMIYSILIIPVSGIIYSSNVTIPANRRMISGE